jgi:hypothetical protein
MILKNLELGEGPTLVSLKDNFVCSLFKDLQFLPTWVACPCISYIPLGGAQGRASAPETLISGVGAAGKEKQAGALGRSVARILADAGSR